MLRTLIAGALVSSLSTAAIAAEPQWFVSPGALLCENYFDVADGAAAQQTRDAVWLNQTSCRIVQNETPVAAIVDKPANNDQFAIWRLRVDDESVYVKGWAVGTRLSNGKRINYADYHMHRWSAAR